MTTATQVPILSLIHQANRQAGTHIDTLLAHLAITAQEGQLLAFVSLRDGVVVTAVARLLGLPKSTITSLLRRLERAGLLRREQNPVDARSALLFATAKGRRIGLAARELVMQLERRIQARVSQSDRRALARIVAAVTAETGINLPAESPRRHEI